MLQISKKCFFYHRFLEIKLAAIDEQIALTVYRYRDIGKLEDLVARLRFFGDASRQGQPSRSGIYDAGGETGGLEGM